MTSPQRYRLVGKIDPAHKEFTFTLGGIKGKNGNMLMIREGEIMELTRKEIATAIIKQYKKDRNSTMLDLADAIIRAENKRKPTIVIPAVKVDGRRKFFGYGEVLHVLRRRGDKQTICGYSINEMLPESKRHWKKHLCLACFKKQTLKP